MRRLTCYQSMGALQARSISDVSSGRAPAAKTALQAPISMCRAVKRTSDTYLNHQILHVRIINLSADDRWYIPAPNFILHVRDFGREEPLNNKSRVMVTSCLTREQATTH